MIALGGTTPFGSARWNSQRQPRVVRWRYSIKYLTLRESGHGMGICRFRCRNLLHMANSSHSMPSLWCDDIAHERHDRRSGTAEKKRVDEEQGTSELARRRGIRAGLPNVEA